ncbi:4'-phosphopantetheinyl transferase superfamily protein [Streptomyces sp. JJ66]|uniref:4'-phosphopantetheinyl transferase family protein n=1 Tax=Streptomyces sp. JJ66 TaxID=2803843 RepID=UPI001C586BC9|nr:4'-phosphopantetheinyl transferase superfamily protein [Streptomyces sp. JJ66]MBW1602490.1 4'-phosphopantetheinyl transferase superfamily protein [Streptomyces sp. JJ66]
MPAPSAPPPVLLAADDPTGLRDGVAKALATSGSAVAHSALAPWRPGGPDGGEPGDLRRRLGRDFTRYERMTLPRMRERFAASRLLLRHVVAAAIETAPELVDLSYQPGGRPYVRGCDQIDISLSHTEDFLVAGVTRHGRIGVDAEHRARRMAGTGSESQACTPFERFRLDQAGPEGRNDLLVRLWTLKESYTKARGQGLRLRFTEFGFDLTGEGVRLVRPDGTPVGEGDWSFTLFEAPGRTRGDSPARVRGDAPGEAREGYVVGTAVHDTGWSGVGGLSVETALDQGMFAALLGAEGS